VCSPNLASKQRGGHNRTDYHLTLDMAKELSMVENNEKGRQARRYFIECERRALEALTGNHSEAGVPQMIEHAAEATAMRIAMDGRDRVLTLFGPLANEGDKEQVSGLMIRAKERVKQYLLQLAKRHLKDHGPEQVAAWIMAWTPGKPALV
ncbi:antA/AntB antirepressor family protein, partial [Azovibrio restrictus]|uniref:antA/AntB antirepressor family protein n=1 Tax=Azovibrio restrictus TaxID=146938 RepID=UPI0026EBEC29